MHFTKTKTLIIFLLTLFVNILFSQEAHPILFIGDSFFKENYLLNKIQNNYLKLHNTPLSIDSSLVNGMNCIRQVRNKESLRNKLQNQRFKYIVLQSPSLLKPNSFHEIRDLIDELLILSPLVEKIILVTLNDCTSFPKYKCASINDEIQCNIYQNCESEHDTVQAITTRLIEKLDILEVLPFSQLKRKMDRFSFSKKDDVYGHPSKEIQEILARCFLIWISHPIDESFIQKINTGILSVSQKDIEEIIRSFIKIIE